MTPEELQKLRDWAARRMGWELHKPAGIKSWCKFDNEGHTGWKIQYSIYTWLPDKDANQCFMLVERMRELGWYLSLEYLTTGLIQAGFICKKTLPNRPQRVLEYDTEQCLVILKAARATED